MVVQREAGSDLSTSHKRLGSKSLLTRDADGNLSHATVRDMTDEERAAMASPEPEVVYVTAPEPRRRTKEEEELVDAVNDFVSVLLEVHVYPRVARLWHEKTVPAIKSKWTAAKGARKAAPSAPAQPAVTASPAAVETSQELQAAEADYRINMSSAEAQARYLVALATKAFSEEQMEILANANIEDGEGFAELERALSELSPEQVRDILENLQANPALIQGGAMEQLLKILQMSRFEVRPAAIEERIDR